MAGRLGETIITLQGGFATDLSPQVREPVTFLEAAENVTYERSGARRKVGGSTRINSSAMTGTVTGMYDFWLSGSSGTSTQAFVAFTNQSKVYGDLLATGSFSDITGSASITPDAVPVFCQAYDLLCIFDDKNDTPLKWNQTGNVATLGGSPPAGRGMVFHANRGWTWGDNAHPSRLTYSSSTDIEDFTGMDTGSIDIDPEDGDRIVGAISHKEVLLVFKGPHRGSIHQISGQAVADFSRAVMVRGIPLQSANGAVAVGDDVWFMSHRGIHSFQATQAYGNFTAFDLTKNLISYFRNSINRGELKRSWAVNYEHRNCALWTVASVGSTTFNQTFGISYAAVGDPNVGIQPFIWKDQECFSAAVRINPSNLTRDVVFGTSGGYAEIQDTGTYTLGDGATGYTFKLRTPSVLLAQADSAGNLRGDQPVTLHSLYLRSNPSSGTITATVTQDDLTQSSHTLTQGGSGFVLGTSLLGTGTLGSTASLQVAADSLKGDTRSVQVELTQATAGKSAEIYELGIRWTPASDAMRTTL